MTVADGVGTDAVLYDVSEAGVAVITLNNPPVNGLGLATRTAAVEALGRAQRDDGIRPAR